MDNIDVEYAKKKGIDVINTPNASSRSVAELVFTHLFSLVRKTYQSNRTMPLEGDSNFKELKKIYSNGQELSGKTIGILGFGKIGQEVAKIAIGIGMKVLFFDPKVKEKELWIGDIEYMEVPIVENDKLLKKVQDKYLELLIKIGKEENFEIYINRKISFQFLIGISLPVELKRSILLLENEIERLLYIDDLFNKVLSQPIQNKGTDRPEA